MRIAIVASDFNKEVTDGLIDGASRCYKSNFGNELDLNFVYKVPGAFEVPSFTNQLLINCNIKFDAITEEQIDQMYQFTNSYEVLFSKRARKYKSMGLKDKNLKEEDFRNLILEEYTFLKRPVFIVGHEIFVGNSKKTIDALKKCLANE